VFPGVLGYDDSVVPQVVNALLSRHNFILLGLRGQAKTRLLRALTDLLDPEVPIIAAPSSPTTRSRRSPRGQGDRRRAGRRHAVAWLPRDARYVEKLATPDVTVADIVGDIDPIKAARLGTQLGDPRSVHYGLLPRANRGIFAINELPDLAGKVQVALFNVMQEGDVQIKGYPVRLPLDVLLVFSANPEDYTARGKIITPLKDRIGSEIRTHYPRTVEDGMTITAQEAWTERDTGVEVPAFVARSSRRSPSRRATTRASTSTRACRSGCRSASSRTWPRTPSGAPCSAAPPLAHVRPLRGAVGDHRQARARVRGRAQGRRGRRARAGPARHRAGVRAGAAAPSSSTTSSATSRRTRPAGAERAEAGRPARALALVPGLLAVAEALAEGTGPDDVAVAAEFVLEGLVAAAGGALRGARLRRARPGRRSGGRAGRVRRWN
jgi:magnesium chelatase subunit I